MSLLWQGEVKSFWAGDGNLYVIDITSRWVCGNTMQQALVTEPMTWTFSVTGRNSLSPSTGATPGHPLRGAGIWDTPVQSRPAVRAPVASSIVHRRHIPQRIVAGKKRRISPRTEPAPRWSVPKFATNNPPQIPPRVCSMHQKCNSGRDLKNQSAYWLLPDPYHSETHCSSRFHCPAAETTHCHRKGRTPSIHRPRTLTAGAVHTKKPRRPFLAQVLNQ